MILLVVTMILIQIYMCISNRIVSNKILELVKIYAIKSYTNNEKLLLLIIKVILKVIYCYLLTFIMNKLYEIIFYIYL